MILAAAPLILATVLVAAPLRVGDTLPVVTGETLSGNTMALPAAVAGKAAILVFSFSRAGGNDAHIWNDHVAIISGDNTRVPSFTVMMLESAPRILRGVVASGIKNQMSPAMRDRSIVVYRDEAIWKQGLAVSDDRRAYVLLIDGQARISWMNSGPFSDSAFALLKDALSRVHPP